MLLTGVEDRAKRRRKLKKADPTIMWDEQLGKEREREALTINFISKTYIVDYFVFYSHVKLNTMRDMRIKVVYQSVV